MSPVRVWFGLVFLAMGVLAILDATGAVAWSSAFDGWWPVAIAGWGLAEMVARQASRTRRGRGDADRVALCWRSSRPGPREAVVWSVLFLLVGAAILLLGRQPSILVPAARIGRRKVAQATEG